MRVIRCAQEMSFCKTSSGVKCMRPHLGSVARCKVQMLIASACVPEALCLYCILIYDRNTEEAAGFAGRQALFETWSNMCVQPPHLATNSAHNNTNKCEPTARRVADLDGGSLQPWVLPLPGKQARLYHVHACMQIQREDCAMLYTQ